MGDKLLLLATAIGLSCAIGSAAQAAPNHGWYVAAEIGANWTDASGKLAWGGMLGLTPHDSTLALADGTADLLTLGHVLNDRFALELEVGYRRSDIPNSADAAHQTDRKSVV